VQVVESRELRGFSENNNLALRQAAGKYCFIVNDDTLMTMPVIDALVADFGRLPADAAIVSPKIVFPDGRVQTCGRAPWTAWRYVKHYLHRVDETVPTPWSMQEGLFRTWTVNGACFLIRTDVFRAAGWFDETYTFTPEDIAIGHKINEMGYTVWADADVEITHLAGGTVSRMEAAIKPTRVRGALQFYSGGSKLKYAFLGSFVWCVEALRRLKYRFADRSDPSSHAAIMYATAGNVMRSIFTRRTSKEIFTELYQQVIHP
jgi:GT2 family glycosyltransferase